MDKIKILLIIILLVNINVTGQEIKYKLEEVVVTGEKSDSRSKITSQEIENYKVIDIAETLSEEMVEISLIRKGAYGNEISLRGFGKSNLRVLVDNDIIEGACGGRKDPALSHINMLTIGKIQVQEGPFDVTKQGALGGSVSVWTKKPREGFHSEIITKGGSFNFLSSGFSVTGGNKKIQALMGYNYSKSGQYKDGDGRKLSSFSPNGRLYNKEGLDMNSFQKHDVWGKIQIKPNINQTLLLSCTYGIAEDIMSPRGGMDMETEKTIITKAQYSIRNLGNFSKKLTFSAYRNMVNHNPYDKYRDLIKAPNFHRHNEVKSIITGGKIENKLITKIANLTLGLDIYSRNWDGVMYNDATNMPISKELIPDVDISNIGFYLKANKVIDNLELGFGMRSDRSETKANKPLPNAKSKLGINSNRQIDFLMSGYITGKYNFSNETNLFAGIGQSARTPTAAERYLQPARGANFSGNPNLKPTKNREFDLGFETLVYNRISIRIKTFYSFLKNYIYQESSPKTWINIDAHIYGGDITAIVDLTPSLTVDASLAYQCGRKNTQPRNNNDKNLAEIPPLKTQIALKYKNRNYFGVFQWVYSANAKHVDIDAGEQRLAAWNIFNVRAGVQIWKIGLNVGINNILNETYAVANSYEWDVVSGAAATPAIIYEPGRFMYLSVSLKF